MEITQLTNGFNVGGITSTILTGGYIVFLVFLVMFVIGGLAWFFWWKKQYKYSVKLKILQNKQFVYYEDVARKIIDKDTGTPRWHIKGLKEKVSLPPGESMYLTPKGGWVAEGYYDRSAGVIWGKDTQSKEEFEEFAKKIALARDGKVSGAEISTHFQPLTTAERSLQAQQVTKAVLRRGKDFWTMLWQLAPAIILLCVFALILIFWGNIAKPVQELQGANVQAIKDISQIQQQNLRFYQMLTGGRGNGTYIIQVVPSDEALFNGSGVPG